MSNMNSDHSTMIIEGFICPECQQDMSSIELLQAHFELMHIKKSASISSNLTSLSSFAQDNQSDSSNRSAFSCNYTT